MLSPGPFVSAQICTTLFSGWGFAPDPAGEAHSAPPNPLAGKGEGKEWNGEQEGEGREARGGCLVLNSSLAIRPWFACNVCQCKRCRTMLVLYF